MKKSILTLAIVIISFMTFAQNDTIKTQLLDEVSVVSSYRVKPDNGSMVIKETIDEQNTGQEPCFVFSKMPSMFSYGDNGSEYGSDVQLHQSQ